jgi:hypothetical protein
MTNEVIRQFFKNYLLIREQGFDAFTCEQSKLFSPKLLTLVSDTRGSFIYEGIDGFFEGTVSKEGDHDWTEEFEIANDLITKVAIKLFFNQPA